MMMARHLQIHPKDNVAVALRRLEPGDRIEGLCIEEAIPRGHKFALYRIGASEEVIKYGMPIGRAVENIAAGRWVHTHNLRTCLNESAAYPTGTTISKATGAFCSESDRQATFLAYPRQDGRVGIRNELWIIPTVGCVNGLVRRLAHLAEKLPGDPAIRCLALEHPYGCSQLGDDLKTTAKLLAALARHPNAGGTLIVSLGCENNTLESFLSLLGDFDPKRVLFLKAQEPGDETERALELLRRLLDAMRRDRREPVGLEKLVVGLKCGGSDGFSGITANPLVGAFSDRLTASGGTTLLTEVPEMFGAETLLMERCIDQGVLEKCIRMVGDFKRYFVRHGQPVYENPSPGNKEGGLSTLEEKSLGCTQKGGTGPVVDVLEYGDQVRRHGLNLLAGPGNDMVASTALAAAGCHLILFTTGRGTPLGTVVPTVKIASNSELARDKTHWIDFDAGRLLQGVPPAALLEELFSEVLPIASGLKETRNETNDSREIAIFKDGVIL